MAIEKNQKDTTTSAMDKEQERALKQQQKNAELFQHKINIIKIQQYEQLLKKQGKLDAQYRALSDAEKLQQLENDSKNRIRVETQTASTIQRLQNNIRANGTTKDKSMMVAYRTQELAEQKKAIEEEYALNYAATIGNVEAREKLNKKYYEDMDKLEQSSIQNKIDSILLEQQLRNETFQKQKTQQQQLQQKGLKSDQKGLKGFGETVNNLLGTVAKVSLADFSKQADNKYKEAKKHVDELEATYDELEKSGASKEVLAQQRQLIEDAKKDSRSAYWEKALADTLNKISDSYNQSFKQAEQLLTDTMGVVNARLQGSGASYQDIMNTITSNLSLSPYVKSTKVIESMKKAVDEGIAYNIEQRAFLNSISDKIANTFDAFDSNLTRLIKLQQADTTAARLGMEASLTKFFNNMFNDTSYLTNLSDTIAGTIIDANAVLSRDESTQFEYIVQKWLGSLYSLGMGESAISSIAQGINYLATGDVTNLSNNTQLQTLMAMSASKANLPYAELLINGLDANKTNQLMAGMVQYLQEVVTTSSNQVVKAAYGDVLNLSLSDMRAISNLTSDDIQNIAANVMTYENFNEELGNQFNSLWSRTSLTEKLSNIYENAVFGVASDMVNNPLTYALTKAVNFLDENNVYTNLPFINAFGSGIDLNTSLEGLMKGGVFISQGLSLMSNIVSGLKSGSGLKLSAWNGSEYNTRGSTQGFVVGSAFGDTSFSTEYTGGGNQQDIKRSSLSQAVNDASDVSEITQEAVGTEHNFDEFYNAVVGNNASDFVNIGFPNDNVFLVKEYEASGLKIKFEKESVLDIISQKVTDILSKLDTNKNITSNEIAEALASALGLNATNSTENTTDLNTVLNNLVNGNIIVQVKNVDGDKLAVDTEMIGVGEPIRV